MELDLIARFHAAPGQADALAAALQEVAAMSRAEGGCLDFQILRGRRDPELFFIHSRWADERAFDEHAEATHTKVFLALVDRLTDQTPEVSRTWRMNAGSGTEPPDDGRE